METCKQLVNSFVSSVTDYLFLIGLLLVNLGSVHVCVLRLGSNKRFLEQTDNKVHTRSQVKSVNPKSEGSTARSKKCLGKINSTAPYTRIDDSVLYNTIKSIVTYKLFNRFDFHKTIHIFCTDSRIDPYVVDKIIRATAKCAQADRHVLSIPKQSETTDKAAGIDAWYRNHKSESTYTKVDNHVLYQTIQLIATDTSFSHNNLIKINKLCVTDSITDPYVQYKVFMSRLTDAKLYRTVASSTKVDCNGLIKSNKPAHTITDTARDTAKYTKTDTIKDNITDNIIDAITDTVIDAITDTATDTESDSATDTKTVTITDAATDTKTVTITDTATDTITDTATDTESDTESDTAPDTKIVIITDTATDTITDTATDTESNTATYTKTVIITDTATDTESDTAPDTKIVIITDTATDTITDTATDTESDTAPDTKTVTITDTITDNVTDTKTVTITDTITDTKIYTKTDTETVTATDTITDTNALSQPKKLKCKDINSNTRDLCQTEISEFINTKADADILPQNKKLEYNGIETDIVDVLPKNKTSGSKDIIPDIIVVSKNFKPDIKVVSKNKNSKSKDIKNKRKPATDTSNKGRTSGSKAMKANVCVSSKTKISETTTTTTDSNEWTVVSVHCRHYFSSTETDSRVLPKTITPQDTNSRVLSKTITAQETDCRVLSKTITAQETDSRVLSKTITSQDTNSRVLPKTITSQETDSRVLPKTITSQETDSRVLPKTITAQETDSRVLPKTITSQETDSRVLPKTITSQETDSRVLPKTITSQGTDSRVLPKTITSQETDTRVLSKTITAQETDCRVLSKTITSQETDSRVLSKTITSQETDTKKDRNGWILVSRRKRKAIKLDNDDLLEIMKSEEAYTTVDDNIFSEIYKDTNTKLELYEFEDNDRPLVDAEVHNVKSATTTSYAAVVKQSTTGQKVTTSACNWVRSSPANSISACPATDEPDCKVGATVSPETQQPLTWGTTIVSSRYVRSNRDTILSRSKKKYVINGKSTRNCINYIKQPPHKKINLHKKTLPQAVESFYRFYNRQLQYYEENGYRDQDRYIFVVTGHCRDRIDKTAKIRPEIEFILHEEQVSHFWYNRGGEVRVDWDSGQQSDHRWCRKVIFCNYIRDDDF